MICEAIISGALTCQPVQTPRGAMHYVSLPYSLTNGACLSVYVIEQHDGYLVTDDGKTIFSMQCNDINLSDRRRWTALRNVAARHGFEMSEGGAIKKHYARSRITEISADVLMLMADVVNWEASVQETGDYDLSLHSRVEELLTAIYHTKPEASHPVTGPHGARYTFDFYVNELHIDAFKPHALTTGSKLRKLHDLSRLDHEMKFLMVLDDRYDANKASVEMGIFSNLAQCTLVSSLERRVGRQLNKRH